MPHRWGTLVEIANWKYLFCHRPWNCVLIFVIRTLKVTFEKYYELLLKAILNNIQPQNFNLWSYVSRILKNIGNIRSSGTRKVILRKRRKRRNKDASALRHLDTRYSTCHSSKQLFIKDHPANNATYISVFQYRKRQFSERNIPVNWFLPPNISIGSHPAWSRNCAFPFP